MKKIFFLLISVISFHTTNAQITIYNNLLQKHVSETGAVNYASFKSDEKELDSYLNYLRKTTPDKNWSENKQKAFWINVYNAYTIKLILKNHPLKSIMDVKEKGKTAWKIPFVKVGGKVYSLDFVEHEILRKKLFDPRIHVGVNCASISCPKLLNIAFTEENVEAELEKLMKEFVNDTSKNKFTSKKTQISLIFDWFKEDFTKNGSVIDYLNRYSSTEINPKTKISYLKYNWSLNDK